MSHQVSAIKEEVDYACRIKDTGGTTEALLEHLNKIFRENSSDIKLLTDVCKACTESGFLDLFCLAWEELKSPDVYNDPEGEKGKIFRLLKEVIWNYSDRCPELCRDVYYDKRIVDLLLEELKDFALALLKLRDKYKRHHVKANFGILHNLLRHYDDVKSDIRKDPDRITTIACYTRSDYVIIQAYAYVILAFCTESNDNSTLLLAGDHVFKFLHELLKETINSPDHISEKYGLSTMEVVQCIAKLAKCNANMNALIDCGLLDTITNTLDDKSFSSDEIYQSLDFVWTLSLHKTSDVLLRQNTRLVEKIKALNRGSTSDNVKRECASILYTLEPHQAQNQKHIMISYQWDTQEAMKKLYKYLTDEGFSVWMDIYGMSGSIYNSMAGAVENAAVILMAITEKYKESENVKKEAEYAGVRGVSVLPLMLEKGYKPDGWLGIMLGAKLYIEVDPKDPTPAQFEDIKKHIGPILDKSR